MRIKLLVGLNWINFLIIPLIFEPMQSQQTIDVGKIGVSELEILYKKGWFSLRYEGYCPNTKLTDSISKNLKSSEIVVFMGTWCHDTKLYLPKLIKTLDYIKMNKERVVIFNVDKKKRRPRDKIKDYGIKYLPTFVFIQDEMEVGRIVEFPFYSLEEDIIRIYNSRK